MARPAAQLIFVDDEPDLRSLLAEYFGRHGFDVRTAADGAEARALVGASPPDAMVLDINMPGGTGLSLARWLRDAHPGMGLVLLTTAGEAVDRIVATAESGAVAVGLLAAAHFDAIVPDLRMPDIDGAALWRTAHDRHPALAQRMLFVTGDPLSPGARRFLA